MLVTTMVVAFTVLCCYKHCLFVEIYKLIFYVLLFTLIALGKHQKGFQKFSSKGTDSNLVTGFIHF